MRGSSLLVLFTILIAGTAGAAEPTPEARKEAEGIFAARCSTCHGPQGKGDGPAAVAFPVKPRNFGDAEWQKTASDEHLEKVIVHGGASVGKSPLMAPNPDLAAKPSVLAALREKIRSFAR